ncbi:MAG TPA: acyl-CoA dehydrogenase [Arthrobacter sp.]|nr:acyl-CoA dehydrogenase [Arthrobacter sp.]
MNRPQFTDDSDQTTSDQTTRQEAGISAQTVQFTPGGSIPETAFTRDVLAAAERCVGDPAQMIHALQTTPGAPLLPGRGETAALWELLASVAAVDLTAARTLEPHLDAAAILDQAGLGWEPGSAWGVFAAEGPGLRLEATPGHDDGTWLLSGDKPWCSLAGSLDAAVITATVPDGRRAFALDLRQTGVVPVAGTWASHGLAQVPSGPVRLDGALAHPVGATGWYLQRDGFAWGSLAVASCWFGGAVGLFRTLHVSAGRREPDQLALAWLGEADRWLASGASLLAQAGASVDTGTVGWRQAHRVRGQIALLCERLLALCGQALGPGPLAFDAEHARRVSDLQVYIRQHHAARDDAALGRLLLEDQEPEASHGTCPW